MTRSGYSRLLAPSRERAQAALPGPTTHRQREVAEAADQLAVHLLTTGDPLQGPFDTLNPTDLILRRLLAKLARFVNSVAGGDMDKARCSGFDLAKCSEPIDKLQAPLDHSARMSSYAGV